MNKVDLIEKLNKASGTNVYIKVEGDLYYPIKDVKVEKDGIVILCKNIKISAKDIEFKPATLSISVKSK